MKPQAEIGRVEGESKRVRGRDSRGYRGQRSGIRARGLLLSLFVVVGAAEFTMGRAAKAAPQNANSVETTSQSFVKTPAQDWHPQIIVRVHNYAQVEASVLLGGEQIAADIVREAGVDTVWLACSAGEGLHGEAGCAKPQTPLDLNLNLVTSAQRKQFRLVDDTYGFAIGSMNKEFTCDAWVFYDLLKDAALKFQMNTAHILGNIIAHEFGHLLLGANAHTSWGLMRARWSPEQLLAADRGELSFSNVERARIHNSVVARHQAQVSAQAQQTANATGSTARSEIPAALGDSSLSK
jgi:hypothetical protein